MAGGTHAPTPYEAWIAAKLISGEFKVLITGPAGSERVAVFAIDEDPAIIKEHIRETIDEE